MLAFQPLGFAPLALPYASSSGESVVGERIGGDVFDLVQRSTGMAFMGVELVQQVLVQREKITTLMLDVTQSYRIGIVNSVDVTQRVEALSKHWWFEGRGAYSRLPFDLHLSIGGERLDLCRLFDDISIGMGEDEAATAQLVLKPREVRGENIDLYRYQNQELHIDVENETGTFRLFTGVVDACGAEDLVNGRRLSISATDARERRLNQQPRSWIEKIGYFSDLVFKKIEEYDFQAEEITDRISTIPYSVEWFEGSPFITALRPKSQPDFVIGPCVVKVANPPSLGLSSSERHINAAELTLQIQSHIAYQREMDFYFDSGYGICEYFTHSYPPAVSAVQSAANGAGWMVRNFSFEGLLDNQWVQCPFMSRPNFWGASKRGYENDEGHRTVENLRELYAHRASWVGAKRWIQPAEERYKVRVQNVGSIARFGEQKKQYSLSISNDVEQIKDDKEMLKWEDWESYKTPSSKFQAIPGGWARWLNNIEVGTNAAIQCVMAQMSTDILKSHRDSCNVEIRFAPEIDLRHTVLVDIPNLKCLGKVSGVTHTFDLSIGVGKTQLEIKYFANGSGFDQDFNVVPLPQRGVPKFFAKPVLYHNMGTERISLGATVVEEGDEENEEINKPLFGSVFLMYKADGNIVKEYPNPNRNDVKLYKFDQFVVRTPEIEQESTDTMDITLSDQVFDIGIFNQEIEVYL